MSPTVVYIAGSGRSGSTLLERSVGQIAGYVNVGELIDLFRREAPRGERCGCGQRFADCAFWSAVLDRALAGFSAEWLAQAHPRQQRVARQRHLLRLALMPLAGAGFHADLAEHARLYAALYSAIAAQAGAGVVVDASKWPTQALALYQGGVDIRVINLVRDVRGVAYSLTARARQPAATAVRWVSHQGQASVLRRCGLPFVRVRYEDFVAEPRHTVASALTALSLPFLPSDLGHLGRGEVTLTASHGIHGNRGRFTDGTIPLVPDESWRTQMPLASRVLVTMIALPALARHGLTARGGAVAGGADGAQPASPGTPQPPG